MSNATILETPVVVCGGGPIGMLFALRLAQLGVQCLLAEQNTTTSNLPKMDVTNIRTMEILRAMGLAEGYRQFKPVEELSDWVTPFTTGMGPKGHHLFTWVSQQFLKHISLLYWTYFSKSGWVTNTHSKFC